MLKKNTDIKNILSINPYDNVFYNFKKNKITKAKNISFDKLNYVSSFILNKETIVSNININNSIPDEDVEDILLLKVYEELNLDEAIEYTIKFIELKNANIENERVFSVFVVEVERLFTLFKDKIADSKFIDSVVPAALLYKPLYTRNILEDKKSDIFIYITKEDASITLYRDGEYLYSKSIPFSLNDIYEKFSESSGNKLDEDKFFKILKEDGLKSSNEEYQQHLIKVLGDMFVNINDVIIYIKRAFKVENIDNLFIGTDYGNIIGLDSYSNNYLGLASRELDFDYGISHDEYYINQYHYLLSISSEESILDEGYNINFSIFPRPPAFQNRASGQFIIALFLSISVAIGYPLFFLVNSYINDAKIYGLNIQNTELSIETTKYKSLINNKLQKIKVVDSKIERENNIYVSKTKTLNSIYDKKVNYRMKSNTFHNIAKDIEQFDIKVNHIKSDNDKIYLTLIASDDVKVTEFIKYISSKYFEELKFIDIEELTKVEDGDFFTGILKVELKWK